MQAKERNAKIKNSKFYNSSLNSSLKDKINN